MRLYVGTRKGLFTVEKTGATFTIARAGFFGVPVTMTLFDTRNDQLFAGVKHGHFGTKLHRSGDRGMTWAEIGTPKFPEKPSDDGDENPWSLDTIWSLEAGPKGQQKRLWCGTIPGGLFRSDDAGETWQLVRSLWDRPERKAWFGGGADEPGIHSIWIHPNDPNKIRVGISIGGVWMSDDDGETWRTSSKGMRAAYMPPEKAFEENAQDPHRVVQCRSRPEFLWCQHHNGVFRSTDGGATWSEIENIPPSTFGFAVAVHPMRPDIAWLVPAQSDEIRAPVDGKVVVTKTIDGGKTWSVKSNGLPQVEAYDLTFRHSLDVDESGNVLAFGTTTGAVFVSEDGGERWIEVTAHLPPIYSVRFEGA